MLSQQQLQSGEQINLRSNKKRPDYYRYLHVMDFTICQNLVLERVEKCRLYHMLLNERIPDFSSTYETHERSKDPCPSVMAYNSLSRITSLDEYGGSLR